MSTLNRRRFLEDSLLAAAATAVAASSPAWSAERNVAAARGKRVGPNDQIRMAVIGVNSRGVDHVQGYTAMQDVTITTICDVDPKAVGKAMTTVTKAGKPQPAYVQDLRNVMEDPNIDAVSIATTNHWHALASIWAMQNGKDVYVEKPVSHNVWEGRKIVEAARKYNRICQAGTQIRSSKGVQDAIAYMHQGKIGKVELARGLCYKTRNSIGTLADAAVPEGVDYDLWLGPAPQRAFNPNRFHYNWHWHWDYGNGDLGNQGIHQMDIARWGLNKPNLPVGAMSVGGRFGYVDQGETPNTQIVFLDYDDSQLIFEVRGLKTDELKVNPTDPKGAKVGILFYGTEGYVAIPSYNGGAAFDANGKMVATFEGGGNHYRNFIDAVRSRDAASLAGPIREGHISSACCHLGNISYQMGRQQPFNTRTRLFGDDAEAYETFARFEQHLTDNGVRLTDTEYRVGRKLRVDPDVEDFGRDREANGMLSRDYRKPFVVPKKV